MGSSITWKTQQQKGVGMKLHMQSYAGLLEGWLRSARQGADLPWDGELEVTWMGCMLKAAVVLKPRKK